MLLHLWPDGWTRQQRSTATLFAAAFLMMAVLWAMGSLLGFAPEPIGNNAQQFAKGARVTLWLTVLSYAIGLVGGVVIALMRTARYRAVRWLARTYIWAVRGTPLLVQIFFVFFALPLVWQSGVQWLQELSLFAGTDLSVLDIEFSEFTSATVALAINVTAYNAEAVRAGLHAVPRGQTEAAQALGLGRFTVFFDVVFPQAFKVALPSLVNNLVIQLKDSSLAYAIGVVELMNVGNRINASAFQPVPTLITVAIIYLVLTTLVTQISDAVEYRFDVEGRGK